jgi:hypothetical protein
MKTVEYWRWRLASATKPGKRTTTSYVLTEEEALRRDPTAERMPGTRVEREVPETEDESQEALYRQGLGKQMPQGWKP